VNVVGKEIKWGMRERERERENKPKPVERGTLID